MARTHPLPVALLIVASTLASCSEESAAKRRIRAMRGKDLIVHAIELQRQGTETWRTIQDRPSAEAAAQKLDRLARDLDRVATRIGQTEPASIEEHFEAVGNGFGGVFASGLGALGTAFQLLGKPELLKIVEPSRQRFEAARESVTRAITAPR